MPPPSTIAHYRITAKLGEGGMGTVYRATDTKLGREVAIKVLPASLANDADYLARFEREAQVLASLNHPNIAILHGLEESGGVRALVMELVEGLTLAERIAAGPLPLEEALAIARQIAEALEAAHEKGVIHRDLKPANVKVTPEGIVKVLDFGLAKAAEPAAATSAANSPTLTIRSTQIGMILGTAAYMSPEQATGKRVDRRADIWSFGVVLAEMLTGRRMYTGENAAEILAAVILKEPDLASLPPATPAAIRRLLRRCLDKDPRLRLRDIGEARVALASPVLEETAVAPGPTVRRGGRLAWALAGALTLALVFTGTVAWRATRPPDRPLLSLNVDLGPDALLGLRATVAVSPDGSRLAHPARLANGRQGLAVRVLSQSKATPLAGTEDATVPFFSPDGQWVAFFANGKLKKIPSQGGAAVVLCDAPGGRGATWGDDGNIYATLNNSAAVSRIPENGGAPQPATKLREDERAHRWPQILPGSQVLLFSSNRTVTDWDEANIEAFFLRTGERKILQRGGFFGRYLPSGHLVYLREGSLYAARFDAGRMALQGAPTPLLTDVAAHAPSGGGQFDFAANGLFVYAAGKGEMSRYTFGWMRAGGKVEPLNVPEQVYAAPRLSPDGKRLAHVIMSSQDIWVYDLERGTSTRLTPGGNNYAFPVWTRDGRHIVYSSRVQNGNALWWARADGSGSPLRLAESNIPIYASSFSPEGRTLACFGDGIWTLSLDLSDPDRPKPGTPERLLPQGGSPAFSPEGRWIAYVSFESGASEVYVRPAPGNSAASGGKWLISTGGAKFAVWSPAGRQLFYATPDNHVMVVDYTAAGAAFSPGKPRPWSATPIGNASGPANFDVAPDGQRLLACPASEPEQAKGNLHLVFLLNFFDELKRRLP